MTTYNWRLTLVQHSTQKEIVRTGDGGFDRYEYAKAEAMGRLNSTIFWQDLPDGCYLKKIETFPEVQNEEATQGN